MSAAPSTVAAPRGPADAGASFKPAQAEPRDASTMVDDRGHDNDRDDETTLASFAIDHQQAVEMSVSGAYERKVSLINREIVRMGFGKFQWWLFFLSGGGWAVDNIYFEGLAMSLPQIEYEFNPPHVQFMTVSLYVGLLVGAVFWGFGCDVIGRRFSWNATLFLSAVFAMAVAGAPSFVGAGALLACTGLGIGGNLPVDGAMLIEFLPGAKQWTLTLLSVFWVFGQVFAALIGWAFITNYRCDDYAPVCTRANNMGWRYTWLVCGGVSLLLWAARFFVYPIPESPKYLISQGRDAEAIEVLQFIAQQNGVHMELTLDRLIAAGREPPLVGKDVADAENEVKEKGADASDVVEVLKKRKAAGGSAELSGGNAVRTKWNPKAFNLQQLRASLAELNWSHVKALFATRKMAWNTTLIMLLWSMIGLAYPLFNGLIALYIKQTGGQSSAANESQAEQYRQLVIIAILGIPGSLIATLAVELPYAGRKGSMAFFTLLTGCCLIGFATSARTPGQVLGWNCGVSLAQNAMYGVLYAMTYEVFPAPHRGTGDGLSMGIQRVFGVIAPLVSAFSTQPKTPIFVSAALFISASIIMLFLPYESRGRTAL